MDIKDIIYTRRKSLGYSLEKLAKMVGVSKQTVQKWECGRINNMKRSNIAALSQALNVPIEDLMGWDSACKTNSPGVGGLTEGEEQVLELFRRIPEDRQKEALDLLELALRMQQKS